jgi:hypothetical protein|tara:strand:- start:477 stop:848 length:372 start_codon:yes stop_codon:yes gene_type:complete
MIINPKAFTISSDEATLVVHDNSTMFDLMAIVHTDPVAENRGTQTIKMRGKHTADVFTMTSEAGPLWFKDEHKVLVTPFVEDLTVKIEGFTSREDANDFLQLIASSLQNDHTVDKDNLTLNIQ